jgi:hypothetical protein
MILSFDFPPLRSRLPLTAVRRVTIQQLMSRLRLGCGPISPSSHYFLITRGSLIINALPVPLRGNIPQSLLSPDKRA